MLPGHFINKIGNFRFWIIPLIWLILHFMLLEASGPFYLTRIDPDYVYLMNGLNVSMLHFDRIGHLDHPGTPFQVFIGIIIRLVFLLRGQGDIFNDVLNRPEFYLRHLSVILAVGMSLLIYVAGRVGEKRQGWQGLLILQCTPFLSMVIPDLSIRVMPELFGMMLIFTSVLLILHDQEEKHPWTKALSAFLIGLSIAVKINFLPCIFLPWMVFHKNRVYISLVLAGGFLVGILPILGRFKDFSSFVDKLIYQSGSYGSGEPEVLNYDVAWMHFKQVLELNQPLVIIFLLGMTLLFFGKIRDFESRLLKGFLLVVILGIVMVLKHFKNYYLAPVLILTGVGFFVSNGILSATRFRQIPILLTAIFSLMHLWSTVRTMPQLWQVKEEREIIADKVSELKRDHYFLIKPEWLWGPAKEYGLVFGTSYVRHRDRYANQLKEDRTLNLTFEGKDNNLKILRIGEFTTFQDTNKKVVIIDQPGRPAKELTDYLYSKYSISKIDTVPLDSEMTLFYLTFVNKQPVLP